jgi:hypothetical protein
VATFHLERDYRDVAGIHHLSFTQRVDGRAVPSHGLTASVTRSGRLLTLGGSPVSAARNGRAGSGDRTASSSSSGTTSRAHAPSAGDDAARTPSLDSALPTSRTADAQDGRASSRPHSTARVFRYFPGAAHGGHQVRVDLTANGWLGAHARILSGNNAHAFSDVDANGRPSRREEVHPRHGQSWGYPLRTFHPFWADEFCGKPWPCSWNPNRKYSWLENRAEATTQAFYFVNQFHDHLAKSPIGFTEAAGNFQRTNHTGLGRGGDPVLVETDTGANTGTGRLRGLPDEHNIDDAYMDTPPDGQSPTMHLFLNHRPFHGYPRADPWAPVNTADEADTVYHEYTHGLSSRLVVDVRGRETMDPVQGDAMGEAWSDWYAMDYLVDQHLQADRPGVADVRMGVYEGAGMYEDRTEALDCQVGQDSPACGGGHSGHRGGYTYADFGHVVGEPEVHADGEIWGQTLWDLRDRLGSSESEMLVTRAMELAPYNPSFLDMRNAILVADTAVYGGSHHTAIWRVFAHRGMGFDAGTLGAGDTDPAAGYAMPPDAVTTGSIQGRVLDRDTDEPVAGVRVVLAFDAWGAVDPTAVTDADGHYTITDVPVGHYGKLAVEGGHYRGRQQVSVDAGATTADFSLHRH